MFDGVWPDASAQEQASVVTEEPLSVRPGSSKGVPASSRVPDMAGDQDHRVSDGFVQGEASGTKQQQKPYSPMPLALRCDVMMGVAPLFILFWGWWSW